MTTTSAYRHALQQSLDCALDYLEKIDETPAAATASLQQLRDRLAKPLGEAGMPAAEVIAELASDAAPGLHAVAGGRFFGWVIGGSLPAALGADWLCATWDQNAAAYAASPAQAVIEEVCGAWLKDVLGLPAQASFALTTGCQLAHTTALAAARNALLARRDWQVERDGLWGAPRIRILTSDQYHGTFGRAVRMVGFGMSAITALPANAAGQLEPGDLEAALRAHPDQPTIVLLQAGDLHMGAYDDFATLIPLAHRYGAWVHVDGAFGLWANASARYRHLLAGVEHADSWATDGHKWLNVPYDSGFAFVAQPAAHRAAISYEASYIADDGSARDQKDWNHELSRRGRGAATYAALRQLGRQGLAALIEGCCAHAHALTTGIGALPGAQLLCEPQINQGLVRFLDPKAGATPADHDRFTDAVTDAICASGVALFGNSTWRGMRCMRISVSSWQTDARDVERTVAAVAAVLATMR